MDWLSGIKSIAPWIGAALAGPPGLAAMAAKTIAEKVFDNPDMPHAEVLEAVKKGLTPEQTDRLKSEDNAFKIRMQELQNDLKRIEVGEAGLYLHDVQDARAAHSGNEAVTRLALWTVVGFFILLVAVLIFCGVVLFGAAKLEQGIATAAFGLIGTVMGLAGANCAQVYSYFFGSSQGSKDKSEALNRAVAGMGSVSYAVAGDSPPTPPQGSPPPSRGAPPPRKG